MQVVEYWIIFLKIVFYDGNNIDIHDNHVKSFCVNQKWKSSSREQVFPQISRDHAGIVLFSELNKNYAVLVSFFKLIEIKPSFLSFSKGCSLHMQLQWRLPWFQPLPQILIKITIGRGIAGGSHAIASIFHNSQRRAAILFRQFTLVSLPFQKVTFSLFIFCIFVFNIFSSNFPNSCEAIQSYFTSARYYYSQRFVTDFLTFCCWNTSPALHKGQNRQKIRFFNCASSSIVWLNPLRKNSWILNAIHKL